MIIKSIFVITCVCSKLAIMYNNFKKDKFMLDLVNATIDGNKKLYNGAISTCNENNPIALKEIYCKKEKLVRKYYVVKSNIYKSLYIKEDDIIHYNADSPLYFIKSEVPIKNFNSDWVDNIVHKYEQSYYDNNLLGCNSIPTVGKVTILGYPNVYYNLVDSSKPYLHWYILSYIMVPITNMELESLDLICDPSTLFKNKNLILSNNITIHYMKEFTQINENENNKIYEQIIPNSNITIFGKKTVNGCGYIADYVGTQSQIMNDIAYDYYGVYNSRQITNILYGVFLTSASGILFCLYKNK